MRCFFDFNRFTPMNTDALSKENLSEPGFSLVCILMTTNADEHGGAEESMMVIAIKIMLLFWLIMHESWEV